ncbi:hypothetical protein AMK68_01090 [candidate division KD3-62 bacterium DG_56]|uniref:PKD domain-containing protein n=1 Tax=candidate division KD3-62 bacterium DG_56 TaxID=1704032 RepID=A0A0S7XQC2_9BACT|nr:MAG: hypothetical protein AMK68_01090 [candidate division KD3-62 bacterium DG_56]
MVIPANADETQWTINLRLHGPVSRLSDPATYLGVRAGATDDYDQGVDASNPAPPPPGGDSVDLYFLRAGWPGQDDWAQDWRSALAPNTSRTWFEVHATSTHPGQHVLSWVLGAGFADWEPPVHYSLLLYDEGESPDPTGGTSYDMRAQSSLTFYHAAGDSVHYFHVTVDSTIGEPPICLFTWAPTTPHEGQLVDFDGRASSDPDGTIVSWDWDFDDGASGSGDQVTHSYATPGDYALTLTVTDDDGLSETCGHSLHVAPSLCFDLEGNCWHLITIPCSAVDDDPWEVFDELRPPHQTLDLLRGNLHRYDHDLQGYVTYYPSAPAGFGPVTPGDGYWLWLFEDATICYGAECSGSPEAVHFPSAGWYLMGSPQAADTYFDDTLWYQAGTGPFPFSAIMDLWVQDPLFGYSCDLLGYFTAGLEGTDHDHYLRAFKGYWLCTFVGDVMVEVPPPQSPD